MGTCSFRFRVGVFSQRFFQKDSHANEPYVVFCVGSMKALMSSFYAMMCRIEQVSMHSLRCVQFTFIHFYSLHLRHIVPSGVELSCVCVVCLFSSSSFHSWFGESKVHCGRSVKMCVGMKNDLATQRGVSIKEVSSFTPPLLHPN
jgi:hypothetical protein